jgi:hypothetical protein
LFHEGGQDDQCNLIGHLASVGGWFSGCGARLFSQAARFGDGLWGGVSELSKMLNQEDALGAPFFDTVILALRRRPEGCCGQTSIRYFDSTLRSATPDIRLASADAFAVVGGRCTGRAHGCKAKQGRHGKTALTCDSCSYISTVLGSRPERKKVYLVTMSARLGASRELGTASQCEHSPRGYFPPPLISWQKFQRGEVGAVIVPAPRVSARMEAD